MVTHITNDPNDIDGIRAALDAAGYEPETIVPHLGSGSATRINQTSLPRILRATAGGTPLDTLLRLFVLGIEVPVALAESAFGSMPIDRWVDAKLVTRSGEYVQADICILPERHLRIVHDPPDSQGRKTERRSDYVMGVAASTTELIKVAAPARGRALDLGTGCGAVALMMSQTAREVVATDINPRALDFARFNVALNQATNVDVREGSLFEPVEGERFDHIVSNPPFVISPDDGFIYRRGSFEGDGLVRTIVTSAAKYLTPTGSIRMLAQWAHLEGRTWQDRWTEWLADQPLDCFILEHYAQSRAIYPEEWLRPDSPDADEEYIRRWEAWERHLEAQKIEAISTGLVVLGRRADAPGRFEPITEPTRTDDQASKYLTRMLEQWRRLDTLDDEKLLSTKLRVPGDVHLETVSVAPDGKWKTTDMILRNNAGLVSPVRLDGTVATLIGWCDGKRPLRDLAIRLARDITANPESLTRALLPAVRRFIERGYLVMDGADHRPLEQL